MIQPRLVARLALADLWQERVLSLCTVLALAAVLAPLIVLAGLRAGVVEGLREALLQDARSREVVTAANRSLDAALLDRLAARPDVAFLVPRTRTLSASLLLERPGAPGAGSRVELLATLPGDPLLGTAGAGAGGTDEVVLSAAAAARLGLRPGDPVLGRLARIAGGERSSAALALRVRAVAPAGATGRELAWAALPLAVLIEDFQDGRAEIPADVSALPPARRAEYAGFRLYARTLEGLPALDASLRAEGLEIQSRAEDVEALLRTDRNLLVLFALVAGLGGAGFLVSLGAGLWANVERKRVGLAQLRLLGLRAVALGAVPVAQSAVLALLGAGAASAAALAAAALVNRVFAGTLGLDRPLCLVSPGLLAAAAGLTLGGAVLVAAVAGARAAQVEPWEGVAAA